MDCDPNSLAKASACYCGFSKEEAAAAEIFGLCSWASQLESCQVSWTPDTAVAEWTDGSGVHPPANLATFLATADLDTVTRLNMDSAGITSITCLESMPILDHLIIGGNPLLASIDITECLNLTQLQADNSAFVTIDTSNNSLLTYIDAGNSPNLTSLDVSNNHNLQLLGCQNCNITGTLDLSGLSFLNTVNCSSNASLTTLTLTGCTALTTLDCNACALAGLDPTTCTALDSLHCQDNPFGTNLTLDLSNCTVLNDVWGYNCPGIQVVDMTNIGSMTGYIQFQNCVGLTTLTTPNVSNVDQDIRVTGDTNLGALSFPVLAHVGGELDFDGSGVVTVSVPVLLDSGAVSSGKIDGHNCTSLTTFTCTALQQVISGITDFHGCTSLTSLTFDNLSLSQDIDVHGCTSLTSLSFGNAGGTNIAGALSAAGCTSLASVVTTGIAAYGTAPNSTSDFTNCAISPSANINSILADYVLCLPPAGVPFSIDLSGGTSAAPSGQGVLDKGTINATAGCSCVTN